MNDEEITILAVVLGVGYLVFRATRGAGASAAGFTPRDLDAAARTLWAETSALGPIEEQESVVQVLKSRAEFHGRSIYDTAAPPGRPQLWNGSPIFKERWETADQHSRFGAALHTAGRVLSGEAPNLIGPRRHFVHPGGSPRCGSTSECSGRRVCIDGRCLPVWSVAQSEGGNAGTGGTYEPVRVGRAIFS